MFCFVLYTILISRHLHHYNELQSYILSTLISQYVTIILSFISINSENDLRRVLKLSFWGLLILFLIGVANLTEGRSWFLNVLASQGAVGERAKDLGNLYSDNDRFRVQATFALACTYGCANIAYLFLYFYAYLKSLINKSKALFAVFFSLFGIFFCGFRAVWFSACIALIVFLFVAYDIKKQIKYLLLTLIAVFFLYNTISDVRERVDSLIEVATNVESQEEGSSSIEMRMIQFAAVMEHIDGQVLTGLGYGFFSKDLEWEKGRNALMDQRLQGLESIVFSYLLERGIIGLCLYFSFIVFIFKFLHNKRRSARVITGICSGLFAGWVTFIVTTGEQGTFYPVMLIMGVLLKIVYIESSPKKIVQQ